MCKETLIQESQAIIKVVDDAKEGLQALHNHFEKGNFTEGLVDDFLIENHHMEAIIDEAYFVKQRHLKNAIINAHNTYTILLRRWQIQHSEKLTRLLAESQNIEL